MKESQILAAPYRYPLTRLLTVLRDVFVGAFETKVVIGKAASSSQNLLQPHYNLNELNNTKSKFKKSKQSSGYLYSTKSEQFCESQDSKSDDKIQCMKSAEFSHKTKLLPRIYFAHTAIN